MEKLLFLNDCYNREISRTLRLGKNLVSLLQSGGDYEMAELVLKNEYVSALTSETLNKRFELLGKKDYENPVFDYANQFRNADCIVIAAPYWDLGFPAILKTYIEAISIPNFAYGYGEGGRPEGLCKAEKIYYVTTRGGFIGDDKDLGYITIASLGRFYGIKEVKCISVDGLDIPITDIEAVIDKAIADLPNQI